MWGDVRSALTKSKTILNRKRCGRWIRGCEFRTGDPGGSVGYIVCGISMAVPCDAKVLLLCEYAVRI